MLKKTSILPVRTAKIFVETPFQYPLKNEYDRVNAELNPRGDHWFNPRTATELAREQDDVRTEPQGSQAKSEPAPADGPMGPAVSEDLYAGLDNWPGDKQSDEERAGYASPPSVSQDIAKSVKDRLDRDHADGCLEGKLDSNTKGACPICGCSSQFDEFNDRICYCDSCWLTGCKGAGQITEDKPSNQPGEKAAEAAEDPAPDVMSEAEKERIFGSIDVNKVFPWTWSMKAGKPSASLKPEEVQPELWKQLTANPRNGALSSRLKCTNAYRKELGLRIANSEQEHRDFATQELTIWLQRREAAAARRSAMPISMSQQQNNEGGFLHGSPGVLKVHLSNPAARLPEKRGWRGLRSVARKWQHDSSPRPGPG